MTKRWAAAMVDGVRDVLSRLPAPLQDIVAGYVADLRMYDYWMDLSLFGTIAYTPNHAWEMNACKADGDYRVVVGRCGGFRADSLLPWLTAGSEMSVEEMWDWICCDGHPGLDWLIAKLAREDEDQRLVVGELRLSARQYCRRLYGLAHPTVVTKDG